MPTRKAVRDDGKGEKDDAKGKIMTLEDLIGIPVPTLATPPPDRDDGKG